MWHREFDDSKVADWVSECAESAVEMMRKDDGAELSDCVFDAVDGYFIYNDDALALVAYYGVFDCAFGRNESWEDCPAAQFESDVYELAQQILDEED